MDPEKLLWLLSALQRVGVKDVAFSGGEPLLRRDLEGAIAHGIRQGLCGFGVVTNGAAVDAGRARRLAEAGLRIAQVSLDGVDAQDYVAVRACSEAEYHRAVAAIGHYRSAGIRVDIACLLTARNLERAPEMARLAQKLGVTQLRYCSFVPTGRGKNPTLAQAFEPAPERLDQFLDFMGQANSYPDRPLTLSIDHGIGPWDPSGAFRCTSGKEIAYISCEGDLYPCPGLLFPRFKVGNVFRQELGELLRSPAMFVCSGFNKRESIGPCATCTNGRCTGGCRGLSYSLWGDIRRSPPYCRVRRKG